MKTAKSTQTTPTPTGDEYCLPDIAEVIVHHGSITSVHDVCSAMPPMSQDDYESLRNAIESNGQLEPIVLSDKGELLDGRHRLIACHELGITPIFRTSEDKPEAWLRANVARRHLTTGQKASLAARLLPQLKAEAKNRRDSALKSKSKAVVSRNSGTHRGRATAIAAEAVGISDDSVQTFQSLPQDLQKQVESNRMSLNKAKSVSRERSGLPVKKQPAKQSEAASNQSPHTQLIAYENDHVVVLRTLDDGTQLLAYQLADKRWRIVDSTTPKSICTKAKERAVQLMLQQAKKLDSRVVAATSDPVTPKRRVVKKAK